MSFEFLNCTIFFQLHIDHIVIISLIHKKTSLLIKYNFALFTFQILLLNLIDYSFLPLLSKSWLYIVEWIDKFRRCIFIKEKWLNEFVLLDIIIVIVRCKSNLIKLDLNLVMDVSAARVLLSVISFWFEFKILWRECLTFSGFYLKCSVLAKQIKVNARIVFLLIIKAIEDAVKGKFIDSYNCLLQIW